MKKLSFKNLVSFVIFGFIIYSCAYNTKEGVKPAPLPKPNPVDTTSKDTNKVVVVTVKYSEVASVLESKCYGCHSGSGGTDFGDFNTLKTYLLNDSTTFINSITHSPGARKMPEDEAKLPEDKIQKIITWIRQGINP